MKTNQVCHLIVVSSFLFIIFYMCNGSIIERGNNFDPVEKYGLLFTVIQYLCMLTALFALPLSVANFLGITLINVFPDPPTLKGSPLLAPFLCFRVVTKGDFPKLVRDNVKTNMEMCASVGLDNYMFEVVTDQAIDLPKAPRTRELVVPNTYTTSRGSLFKARALQFCLEDGVNMLNDDDWIVHLDEETLLTEQSIIGIFNFVSEGNHQFGQGIITYASGMVVNWVTTLIDSVRVAIDYGALRLTLKILHKPVLNWKGSFIVANVGAEKRVNYDHGPESSIAEDCYFGIMAISMGYSFDFIEGEMHEQSTFTFLDFLRQRRRWVQGIYLAVKNTPVQFQHKAGILCMVLAMLSMPATGISFPLSLVFPVPIYFPFDVILGFLTSVFLFMFVFGSAKSLSMRRYGIFKYTLLCICTLFLIPVAFVLENTAVIWAITSNKLNFHVVRKDKLTKDKMYGETNTVLIA